MQSGVESHETGDTKLPEFGIGTVLVLGVGLVLAWQRSPEVRGLISNYMNRVKGELLEAWNAAPEAGHSTKKSTTHQEDVDREAKG